MQTFRFWVDSLGGAQPGGGSNCGEAMHTGKSLFWRLALGFHGKACDKQFAEQLNKRNSGKKQGQQLDNFDPETVLRSAGPTDGGPKVRSLPRSRGKTRFCLPDISGMLPGLVAQIVRCNCDVRCDSNRTPPNR